MHLRVEKPVHSEHRWDHVRSKIDMWVSPSSQALSNVCFAGSDLLVFKESGDKSTHQRPHIALKQRMLRHKGSKFQF